MLDINDFKKIVRICVGELERGDEYGARDALEPMRTALQARGQQVNCHVGKSDMSEDEVVEWYAGQGLDIVDSQAWHAVNSYINNLDRFVPEVLDKAD